MKVMTCKQLGGAYDQEFRGVTFDEIAALSKQHGMEMFQKQDAEHIRAMKEMQILMKDSEAMSRWFESKKAEFEALPER